MKGRSVLVKSAFEKVTQNSKQGLTKTGEGVHATIVDNKSKIGVTYTSKPQNDKNIVRLEEGNYGYTQIFGKNNFHISIGKMENVVLINVLKNKAPYDLVKSNLLLVNSENQFIRFNNKNKQEFVEITKVHKESSREFINKNGGFEKTKNLLKNSDEVDLYTTTLAKCRKLASNLLEASSKQEKSILLLQNEE